MKTIKITPSITRAVKKAISAALEYEKLAGRNLGITGEVGELLVCQKLKLKLVADPLTAGYDAIGWKKRKYQIKTRRILGNKIKGRMGIFGKHRFDFAVLILLDKRYKSSGIWKMSYKKLSRLVQRHKRRNPPVKEFIKNAK